ncbi:hypothetical protein IFM89_015683 [Coptis chinensis]|uniref:F-box domain-containing protein n=1 Tax=Coptis chinensis TaxID=261450 RepID=A0A835I9W5_9MAGN|nr:hypothetical protein IFM89_015683 [Coptis chinensis]
MRTRQMNKRKRIAEATDQLPDEIWTKILETGIEKSILNHTDLSSFSICCKHFNSLSNDNTLWSSLLTLVFPHDPDGRNITDELLLESKKLVYKYRLERHQRNTIDWARRALEGFRIRSNSVSRRVRRCRRLLTEEKGGIQTRSKTARYDKVHEELDSIENENGTIKKEITKKLAYYKKKYGPCI